MFAKRLAYFSAIFTLIAALAASPVLIFGQGTTTFTASQLPESGTMILFAPSNGGTIVFVARDKNGGCVEVRWSNTEKTCFDRTYLDRIEIDSIPNGDAEYDYYSIRIYRKGNLAQNIESIDAKSLGSFLNGVGDALLKLVRNVVNLLESRDIKCIATFAGQSHTVELGIWSEL